MKVKSERHKVSGSSSAKAHRIRAANLPSHWLFEIQRSEVVRSAGGKLSPIGYSCHRKPASINEPIILNPAGHPSLDPTGHAVGPLLVPGPPLRVGGRGPRGLALGRGITIASNRVCPVVFDTDSKVRSESQEGQVG